MALTFTRVPLVNVGDAITSTHLRKIADALNDRDRCNAGDSCERRVFYLLSLFRQIRNPADEFTFPSQAEFFEAYQNLKATDGTWPVEAPGDPEGANLACFINAFVFGADAIGLDSEDLRVADEASGGVPLYYGLGVPTALEDIWELGKLQRGAMDPDTGGIASPSFRAATEHYKIRASSMSPHGNSYGGFMPVPEDPGGCADPADHNWQIFFTKLADGTTAPGYPKGTCPEVAGDVAAVISTPRYYFVWLNDGSLELLAQNEWIEGPYTGGSYVQKQFGNHLPRVLNAFAADFRGTESERAEVLADEASWVQYAFDAQKFLTRQYHLAPARGTEAAGEVTPDYPFFEKTLATGVTTMAAGTLLDCAQSGTTSYSYHTGFVLASALVTTHRLSAECDIEFWDGATLLKTVTLTPDGSGSAPQIVTFDAAVTATLSIKLPDGATFYNDTGSIDAECSELLEYKPEAHDLYLALRLASCRTSLVGGLDGSGEDEEDANEISDEYFLYGCILNRHGAAGPAGSGAEVNANAVFDAARRLSKGVRILPRAQFTGYEVTGGKSICYFNRYGTVDGVTVDMFDGIAPRQVASVEVQEGIVYKVLGTTAVTYNGSSVAVGATFTGIAGVIEFTPVTETETPVVFEANGIRATAAKQGLTNEWLMGAWLKVYGHTEESLWKPEAYSDYYVWSERCHFYHGDVGYTDDLRAQFDYGENVSLAPEAMTGWRYVHGTNRWECTEGDTDCEDRRRDRYKSCRVMEPLPELEKVEMEADLVTLKLTFKTRFHHHDGAPSSIAADIGTWNTTALAAESYRTMENGLREYLVYLADGTHCVGGGYDVGIGHNLGQQGNSAFMRNTDADPWGFPDNPHGACFPHFYFVQLQQKPYEDLNGTQQSWDTPLWGAWWREAELKIRAMCEGFVDGLTSTNVACGTTTGVCGAGVGLNSLFCYTMESLCFEAFGRKWFTTLGTEATSRLAADQVRTDGPMGFGQLPNTLASSEVYNQFAQALNLLTRVQIMLPMQFQTRSYTGSAQLAVGSLTWPAGFGGCSDSGNTTGGYWSGVPPDASATTAGAWGDASGVVSQVASSLVCDECDGASFIIGTNRTDSEWRWQLVDPDAAYALPDVWAEVLSTTSQARLLAIRHETREHTVVRRDETPDAAACYDAMIDGETGEYLHFDGVAISETCTCQVLSQSGRITAPAQSASSDLAFRRVPLDEGGEVVPCCGATQGNLITIEPLLGDDTAFFEIPLV